MTDIDWIREGARVAEYYIGNNSSAALAVIDRITETQIVLDNGNRYRRDNLRKVGENRNAWSGFTKLLPVDDSQVRDALATCRLDALLRKLSKLPRASIYTEVDVLTALDSIERVVIDTRNAINQNS